MCSFTAAMGTSRRWKMPAARAELKLASGTIVTRYEEETIPIETGQINVVPAWCFLLSLE